MRKIYVMMLTLMVAFAANAASQQLWLIGEPAGGWNPTKGTEMTKTEDGVFTIDVTLEGDKYFSFADQLGSGENDWSGLNSHRYAPESGQDAAANGGVTKMVYPRDGSWKLGAGEWTLTANTNEMTLTVAKKSEVEVEYAYAINGDIWEGASTWTAKAMSEQNGKWVLTADCKATGNFGIRAYKKGGDIADQLAWISAVNASDANLQPGVAVAVATDGTTNFNWTFEGESTFTFDPVAMTLIVENNNYLPEPTYSGMTVFFDSSDKPERDVVRAYMWNTGGAEKAPWPGEMATKIEGTDIWYYNLPGETYGNIIFNIPTGQTADAAAVHGQIYKVVYENGNMLENEKGHKVVESAPYVFDMPASTTIAVHADNAEKVTLGENGFEGDVKEAASFKVVFEAAEGHEIFCRLDVETTAPARVAARANYGGYEALPGNGELEIACGEGTLNVATRVLGVMSTPKTYAYKVVNDAITGVEDVEVEAAGTAVYFNLQGVSVANPEAGHVYIRVLGGNATKVRF